MKEHDPAANGSLLVIDGTNVCFWWGKAFKDKVTGQDRISIRPLLVLLSEIREHGDDFFCVFDASIFANFKERGNPQELSVVRWLLKRYPRRFYIVTGGTQADAVVLHHAQTFDGKVVSGDYYDDYKEAFPWAADRHSDRILRGNFQRTGLMQIAKLKYGYMEVEWTATTRNLFERLERSLDEAFDWKEYQAAKTTPSVETVATTNASDTIVPSPSISAPKPSKSRPRRPKESPPPKGAKKRSTGTRTRKPVAKAKKTPSPVAKKPKRKPVRRRQPRPTRKKGFLEWLFG